jgi:uncharacterized cupin superfamily protein
MSAPPALPRLLPALPTGPGESYRVAPDKLMEGDPLQTVWTDHTDATGTFFAGFWRSEPGTWRVAYTEEEFCQLLEGVSVLSADDGTVLTVRAGDCFVVPRGFVGTWRVVEPTTKRFVIHEAAPT